MDRDVINKILKDVINEAQELNIPVSDYIFEEVIINPRPKKRFACCRKKGEGFQIEISEFILEYDLMKIKQTIAHEILHTCPGCYDHGTEWKKYADYMNRVYGYNIKRVSSMEEMGADRTADIEKAVKYIIKCNACGREYPRQRMTKVIKNIKAYRCICGGKLTVKRTMDK